jgi:hypothetical protein
MIASPSIIRMKNFNKTNDSSEKNQDRCCKSAKLFYNNIRLMRYILKIEIDRQILCRFFRFKPVRRNDGSK